MQAHHTTRGWLAVEWHLGVGGIYAAKLLQCLQFPAWEQPLSPAWGRLRFPAWEHLPVPCLGTFAVPAWDACQFPAWERLPVCMPCLGMLAVPAWDACQFPAWERLPVPCLGTFASALPGHVVQSLPGTLCQFPAWERLPMPCLDMFASPCLGMLFAWTLSPCTFLMLICTSSSLICHAPLQNNDSKKTIQHSVPRILQNNVGAVPLQCASQPQLLRKNTKGVVCVRGENKQKAMCQQ